jgi:hypothetical protein
MKRIALVSIFGSLLLASPAGAGLPTDMDSDGTLDLVDICKLEPLAPNPIGCDTDGDGYGNACDGDLNNDGLVNGQDFNTPGPDNDFLDCFKQGADPGNIGCDINCDGLTAGADFNNPSGPDFLEFFKNNTLGPSGLPCAGTVPCP